MNATTKKVFVKCWDACNQPATHVFTREGSNTLHACDHHTRIDREEAEGRGWAVAQLAAPEVTGYRIAIVRKGQPADRRTCTTGGELRDIVYEVIRAEGSEIADSDHSGLIALIGRARSTADVEGFAALEFGTAAVTIRPAIA